MWVWGFPNLHYSVLSKHILIVQTFPKVFIFFGFVSKFEVQSSINTLMQHPRMDKWNDDHICFACLTTKQIYSLICWFSHTKLLTYLLQISRTNNEHFILCHWQIPPRAVPGLMQDLPLKKIKLLGGKLGEVYRLCIALTCWCIVLFFLLYSRVFHNFKRPAQMALITF